MLFRIAIAGPPTARSLRRPLTDLLTFDDGFTVEKVEKGGPVSAT